LVKAAAPGWCFHQARNECGCRGLHSAPVLPTEQLTAKTYNEHRVARIITELK